MSGSGHGSAPLIALAAGGTGGHMFPAQALAEELKRRGRRVLLVTDVRGQRYTDGFPADEQMEIAAASPSVGGPAAKALAAMSIAGGLIASMRAFRRLNVAAAVGFGGYPSLPATKAAALMKIPYGVHEQNSVLGRANRLLVKRAAFVAHAFPALAKLPAASGPVTEVGNPVRDAVAALAGAPFQAPDGETGEIRILIFGGSQGASLFSAVAPGAVASLPAAVRTRLKVVQQARDSEAETVRKVYADAGVDAEIAPFFKDLPDRMAAAHLIVARSGASTVTELATIGRPSILVPLAIAMDDHQTGNARVLADAGAAEIIAERAFTIDSLTAALAGVLTDLPRLPRMAANARGRVKPSAAARVADLVDEMLSRRARTNDGRLAA